ncbi:MAG: two pore domain potassium channel family protein [Bauldia sp.]|nr:two pore domain potassium channel family protein [Bauldia sp.]
MVAGVLSTARSWIAWMVAVAVAVTVYESIAVEWLKWTILLAGAVPFGAMVVVQLRYFMGAAIPLYRGTVVSREQRNRVFRLAVTSYVLVVFEFALVFTILSRLDPDAFNVGELGLPSAFYFSVTTIATVGFGDIAAVHQLVRLLVVAEIAVGLAYAAFVFAMLAGARATEEPRRDSGRVEKG